jgi:GT2 family glycosyltransferase
LSVHLIAGAPGPPAECYDADVVILALDRIADTLAAIASACGQTGVSIHVFILDQGSALDGLHRLAEGVRQYPNVTLLRSERNLGVAGGRNLLSRLGHGRVIVALDNDAELATVDTAARMVAALDAEPRLAAVGCRIVTYAEGADDLSSWGYPASLLPSAGECFDAVTFVGAGHAIRRSAWEQAGGYDPALFFCWEEFDFCLRAIALGWRIRYRGDIVVRHKVSVEQRVGWTAERWFYFVRNRLYIERKLGRRGLGLVPRTCGYLLKGLRNGLPGQTLRAALAAVEMGGGRSRVGLDREAGQRVGVVLDRQARFFTTEDSENHGGARRSKAWRFARVFVGRWDAIVRHSLGHFLGGWRQWARALPYGRPPMTLLASTRQGHDTWSNLSPVGPSLVMAQQAPISRHRGMAAGHRLTSWSFVVLRVLRGKILLAYGRSNPEDLSTRDGHPTPDDDRKRHDKTADAALPVPAYRSMHMPPAGVSYLRRNDRAHRGSLLYRLMHEVFARIGQLPSVASTAKQ